MELGKIENANLVGGVMELVFELASSKKLGLSLLHLFF